MSEDGELTTIQIPMKVRDRLKTLWTHADDTYESVLNKVLDAYEKKK
jgi:hypothetical protein